MKCPKCHYLSFDPEPRCRNCGYDLELSDDLTLKTVEDAVEGPLVDLTLREDDAPKRAPITLELVHPARAAAAEARAGGAGVALVERAETARIDHAAPSVPPPPAAAPPASTMHAGPMASPTQPHESTGARADAPQRRPSTTSELPLFVQGLMTDASCDRPMVVVPPVPRAPLAVRRAGPEPRVRMSSAMPERKLGPFDRDLLEDLRRVENEHAHRTEPQPEAHDDDAGLPTSLPAIDTLRNSLLIQPRSSPIEDDAPALLRLGAAAIDAGVVGGIGLVVLLSTLRLLGLSPSQLAAVPLLPIAAFLLIVTVGYLLLFTIASGQTLGKMVLGLRVIGAPDAALTIRQAALRELLSVPSVLALGAGFLPAVLGRGPALHDKLAETRVVRA